MPGGGPLTTAAQWRAGARSAVPAAERAPGAAGRGPPLPAAGAQRAGRDIGAAPRAGSGRPGPVRRQLEPAVPGAGRAAARRPRSRQDRLLVRRTGVRSPHAAPGVPGLPGSPPPREHPAAGPRLDAPDGRERLGPPPEPPGPVIRQRETAVPEDRPGGPAQPVASIAPDGLEAFARDLRALRAKADLDYPEMAEVSHYEMKTLAAAAGGLRLPTLPVAVAFVRACDGNVAEWEERWQKLAEKITADAAKKRRNDGEETAEPLEPADAPAALEPPSASPPRRRRPTPTAARSTSSPRPSRARPAGNRDVRAVCRGDRAATLRNVALDRLKEAASATIRVGPIRPCPLHSNIRTPVNSLPKPVGQRRLVSPGR